MNKSKETLKKW